MPVDNLKFREINGLYLYSNKFGDWCFATKEQHNKIQNDELDSLPNKLNNLIDPPKDVINRFYRREFMNNFSNPALHIMHLTKRCNQKCSYCFVDAEKMNDKRHDMSLKVVRKIVDFILSVPGDKTIEFQGGEPTLNFGAIKETTEYIKKKQSKDKITLSIQTNLTNMDDAKLEWLMKNKININSSLDGPREIHDKSRLLEGSGKGSYDSVLSWKKKIQSRYKSNIGLLPVITRYSLSNHKEIIDEYVKNSNYILIKQLFCLGQGKKNRENLGYSIEEFKDFWIKSMDYIIELNKKGYKINEWYAKIIMEKILNNRPRVFTDFMNPCGVIRGMIVYDYKGDVYPCDIGADLSEMRLGNVFDDTYQEILDSEKAKRIIDMSRLNWPQCKECVYQPWCGTCIMQTYRETGRFNVTEKDPTCMKHKFMFDYIFLKMLDDDARNILESWVKKN